MKLPVGTLAIGSWPRRKTSAKVPLSAMKTSAALAKKTGQVDGHRSMIQVGPESAVQSLGYDLTIANSDDVGSGIFRYSTKRMHRSPSCSIKRTVDGFSYRAAHWQQQCQI